ncbi:hypothetical protein NMYAN_280010 [Nitrosomonas nitrosa]|uniref:Uncharacterized protein n=1 Tax=Nitrosomonas nitrosa TaxID=52442 RepID=A0A8H8YZY2_9PROT|nr:hypothetical protein NMYAN_280010 [Nitrosomonas nitrosa]
MLAKTEATPVMSKKMVAKVIMRFMMEPHYDCRDQEKSWM